MNYMKNKFIISILLIIVSSFVIFIFLIMPNLDAIIEISKDITVQKEDLEAKASMGLNIRQISNDLNEIERNIDNLNHIFIQKGKELEFLNTLDRLSAKNLVISQATPQFSENTNTKVIRTPLDIKASGNSNSLISYLKDLEEMYYYFNIDYLEFNGDNNASLSLKGTIYQINN